MPYLFLVLGLTFGTWLGRLPAIRDHLGASTSEMSFFALLFALGSLIGLIFSGQIVHRLKPRRTILVGVLVQTVALPAAAAIIMFLSIPFGLGLLFAYGFAFSVADVALNVSGAGAESSFGKPRLPLMHAGYSVGTVSSTALSSLAEAVRLPVPLHFAIMSGLSAIIVLVMLRNLPQDEQGVRMAAERARDAVASHSDPSPGTIPVIESPSGTQPAFGTMTGAIPIVGDRDAAGTTKRPAKPHRYSPWRDRRILLAGCITFAIGLMEGTPSDWLPIALVDGRGVTNEVGAAMLSVFFASIVVIRLLGSWLIMRFGRVAVLRVSVLLGVCGIVMTILVPGPVGMVLGAILWGFGTGIGWPIAISAAADRAETAARDVATVSALGYGSMLIGPVAFGFLGEHIGLLTSFWALLPFALLAFAVAGAVRPLAQAGRTRFSG